MNNSFTKKQLRLLEEDVREQYEGMEGSRFYRNVDFIVYLIAVALIAMTIRTFLAEPVRVDGRSMYPNLQDREIMLVEKVSYMFSEPRRGDIVICYYPGYTDSCVKRVIGLPGETVTILNGKIYIDGELLDESAYWNDLILYENNSFTVEEDSIFVMGDNRNASKDSRNKSVGSIPYERVLGRVRCVFWPFTGARVTGSVRY